jgi:putative heme-binding domain-containing protein
VFPISARPTTFNRERTDYYNALAGLTVFRGDALGSEYAGSAFAGESLTNLVHHRRLTPEGATFISRRGEHGREFLASSDPWFHPVYMTTGPDGALYIVDFYRRWVEHPAFVAESLRAGVDWRQGHGHGRIWKVSRRENTWPPRPSPNLSRLPSTELARRLSSPNGWMRDSAHRLLVERADPQAAPVLRATIADNRFPTAKPHALSVLEALGLLDDGTLLRALEDGEPRVRQFALRMVAPRLPHSQTLAKSVLNMSDFPHPGVRFELPGALRLLESAAKTDALVKLADLEAADPLISVAIVGNLGTSADTFLPRLLAHNAAWRKSPSAAQMKFLSRVAAGMCSANDQQMLNACLQALGTSDHESSLGELAILQGVDQGLAARGQSLRAMLAKPDASLATYVVKIRSMAAVAERTAADRKHVIEHRLAGLQLAVGLGQRAGPLVLSLLAPDEPESVQLAAAAASSQLDKSALAEIVSHWQALTTAARRAILNACVRSRAGTDALVSAVEAEQIGLGELEPAVRFVLREQRDPELKRRVESILLPAHEEANRAQVVARFEPFAGRSGDRTRGAAVFEKHCLACHMVQGRGQRVGPDLSGVGSRPKQSLLVDIFDPSRELAPNFAAYTLVTRAGQVLSGLIASETAAAVTLRRAEGAQDVVPRAQIEELRATGKSLMPEGLESVLSEDNVLDLLEFLAQPDSRLFSGT